MDQYLASGEFVGAYVDDRILSERAWRAEEGRRIREPKLQAAIDACVQNGDLLCHGAIEFWIGTLSYRIKHAGARHIRIPHILREALLLRTQRVVLDKHNRLWVLCGDYHRLLFSPKFSS